MASHECRPLLIIKLWVAALLVALLSGRRFLLEAQADALTACSNTQRIPAVFGFGTSLSDAGNGVISNPLFFPAKRPPYGSTFFGRPNGRFCDGRTMLDFVGEAVGVPLLKPYLNNSVEGIDFSSGVNYAVAGATVERSGYLLLRGDITFLTTDSLDVQVGWHLSIKQAAESQETMGFNPTYPGATLPPIASFSEALYFIELGGNDYGTSFLSRHLLPRTKKVPIDNDKSYLLQQVIPVVINKLVQAIELLYANEARNILLLNIFPEGCVPLFLNLLNGSKDSLGCLATINEVTSIHNQQLLSAIETLSLKYPDIHLMYADVNKAYSNVLQSPANYGFKETISACCGAGPGASFQFALLKICGPSTYECPNPSTYVVWDGIHNTDAMNNYLISTIASGENLVCAKA